MGTTDAGRWSSCEDNPGVSAGTDIGRPSDIPVGPPWYITLPISWEPTMPLYAWPAGVLGWPYKGGGGLKLKLYSGLAMGRCGGELDVSFCSITLSSLCATWPVSFFLIIEPAAHKSELLCVISSYHRSVIVVRCLRMEILRELWG
jgi:hypothetical protein